MTSEQPKEPAHTHSWEKPISDEQIGFIPTCGRCGCEALSPEAYQPCGSDFEIRLAEMAEQQQPKEAAKWSEPWRIGNSGQAFLDVRESVWICYLVTEWHHVTVRGKTKEETEANAARIVARINFCAGSSLENELEFGPKTYKEAVVLLRDELTSLRGANALLGEQNQRLRVELKDTLALLKASEKGGWDDDSSLERWFPFTADELKSLRAKLQQAEEEIVNERMRNLQNLSAIQAQVGDLKTHVDADAASTKAECQKMQDAISGATESVKGIIHQRDDLHQKLQQAQEENERLKILSKVGEEWLSDSSLEKWFPCTAEEIKEMEQKCNDLRGRLGKLVDDWEGDPAKILTGYTAANALKKAIGVQA